MTLFKALFAAHCPKCRSRLHYTGWDLPYPKYICTRCTNVEEMDMDMSIMHRNALRISEEEAIAFDNFVKRRRGKQRDTIVRKSVISLQELNVPINVATPPTATLYICQNFTMRASICDRCRCNIWHGEGRIESFKEYRNCYEPTVFEIKPIIPII